MDSMKLDINRKIIIQKNFDLVKEKHIFLKSKSLIKFIMFGTFFGFYW